MLADITAVSQLGLGAIALVIIAGCTAFALLRGVFRLALSTALLVAALFVAYWVWIINPGLGESMLKHPPAWFPFILPALAGFATFMMLHKIMRFILKPFGAVDGTPSSFFGKIFSLSFSLVPAALLCLFIAMVIRHVGTIHEIKNPQSQTISALMKKTIDQYIPPAWLQQLDPLTDPTRITLAQLLAMANEEHIPRAIPVADSELIRTTVLNDTKLQKLSKERRFGDVLRDPALDRALKDPRIVQALQQLRKR
jgi:hypothetical protein